MKTKQPKRNIFTEIKNSIDEFKAKFVEAGTTQFGSGWCWLVIENGKITLKTSTVKVLPRLEISGAEIVKIREKLNISRPVFAHALRINPRKLESWEQNRSRVSDEAATLIRLVEKDPSMLEKIRRL